MRKAFTLIELLVVIAIIAILAAILFPVFAQAKEAAKKTACLSNNKNVATALYLYAGDSDDTLCQTSWQSTGTGLAQPFNPAGKYQIHWTYLLQPYIKNWDIFLCPSDSTPVTPKNACPNGIADLGKLNASGQMVCDWQAPKYSYIPNYNLIPAHDWVPQTMTVFEAPADTIMVAERRDKSPNGTQMGKQKGTSGFDPSQPCPNVPYVKVTPNLAASHLNSDTSDDYAIIRVKWDRHTNSGGNSFDAQTKMYRSTGGANYSFADGHAKYQDLTKTLDPNHFEYGDKWVPAPLPGASACPGF